MKRKRKRMNLLRIGGFLVVLILSFEWFRSKRKGL